MAVITNAQRMGRLIGEALEEKGIAQAEFARRAGVSPKHLCQVINGNAVASHGQLEFWAYLLDRRWQVDLVACNGDDQ